MYIILSFFEKKFNVVIYSEVLFCSSEIVFLCEF